MRIHLNVSDKFRPVSPELDFISLCRHIIYATKYQHFDSNLNISSSIAWNKFLIIWI